MLDRGEFPRAAVTPVGQVRFEGLEVPALEHPERVEWEKLVELVVHCVT
jgi:hypothetical protein